jgi:GT2 family glycosyltransferase
MIPQKRKYFILIVHYGDPTRTLRNVLELTTNSLPKKIIIIDHGESPLPVFDQVQQVQLVRPRENHGYGAGLNIGLGMLYAQGARGEDIVICMNNDLRLYDDTLATIDRWWKQHPTAALVSYKKGTVNMLTGRASLAPLFSLWGQPYLHGALLMAPYSVFMTLRGFPEKYFLYWEDVLMSKYARKRRIPLQVATTIHIDHDDIHKPQYSDQQVYYLVRNGALFMEQETRTPWRQVWWFINYWRRLYHRRHPLIYRALTDARERRFGKNSHL